MAEEQGQTEDYLALDEQDIKLKERFGRILGRLGMDVKLIDQIMTAVQNQKQLDMLLGFTAEMIDERFAPLRTYISQVEEYHKKFTQVHAAVEAMKTASGLTYDQAKTCVYYAAATYGLDDLSIFPILIFQGALATGKSTAMQALKKLVNRPVDIGTRLTEASLRDKLSKDAKNSTAFFEEGDTVAEDIVSNRYSRDTAKTAVKRAGAGGSWFTKELDYFGASVLHKRKSFGDPATASRTIVIRTRHSRGSYHVPDVGQDIRDGLIDLWLESPRKPEELEAYAGRAADVWAPLITVAEACGDVHWCRYALTQIQEATDRVRLGQDFEPEEMIVNALIALYSDSLGVDKNIPLADVRNEVKKEYNWQPTSWAIANHIRSVDIEVGKSHGRQVVKVNLEKLKQVAESLDMEDTGLGE